MHSELSYKITPQYMGQNESGNHCLQIVIDFTDYVLAFVIVGDNPTGGALLKKDTFFRYEYDLDTGETVEKQNGPLQPFLTISRFEGGRIYFVEDECFSVSMQVIGGRVANGTLEIQEPQLPMEVLMKEMEVSFEEIQ